MVLLDLNLPDTDGLLMIAAVLVLLVVCVAMVARGCLPMWA